MSQDRNRTDWTVFIGIGLIALGGWLLMGRVLGPFWQPVREAIRFGFGILWPLALIALGVLLLTQSRKGFNTDNIRGRRLMRSRTDKKISGVLGGVAEFFGVDPTLVRIGYVLFGLLSGGAAVVIYIIAAIVVPEAPAGAPQQQPVQPVSPQPAPPAPDPAPPAPQPAPPAPDPAPPAPAPAPHPAPEEER
jgi:phage shock protein PspC (stress-responsive transcriptional regulator)